MSQPPLTHAEEVSLLEIPFPTLLEIIVDAVPLPIITRVSKAHSQTPTASRTPRLLLAHSLELDLR